MKPLTPAEAAAELGISRDTLRAMRKAGEIPYINIGRGKRRETPRYDPADLEAWKQKQCKSKFAALAKTHNTDDEAKAVAKAIVAHLERSGYSIVRVKEPAPWQDTHPRQPKP